MNSEFTDIDERTAINYCCLRIKTDLAVTSRRTGNPIREIREFWEIYNKFDQRLALCKSMALYCTFITELGTLHQMFLCVFQHMNAVIK